MKIMLVYPLFWNWLSEVKICKVESIIFRHAAMCFPA